MQIIVEGWRFIPHSYAIINHFQLLEMLKRPELKVFHQDMPFVQDIWKPVKGLLDPAAEIKLSTLPSPPANCEADVTLRMYCPFNLASANTPQTVIFGCTEWGIVPPSILTGMNVNSFQQAHANSDTIIVTSSHWSREGFIYSGADPDRVVVVPLGVDPTIYKPLPSDERRKLRQKLGWSDYFIFFNSGVMWNQRQGVDGLLKAFAQVVDRYPEARLVLKGRDHIFPSREEVLQAKNALSKSELEKVKPRVIYMGGNLSSTQVAELYQAADVYVSPYLAEGFNLPVLEAAACGLPVICTKGGPTDDFTHPDFTWGIESQVKAVGMEGSTAFAVVPSLDNLITLMKEIVSDRGFCQNARNTGPQWVHSRFTWKHTVDKLLPILAGDEEAEGSGQKAEGSLLKVDIEPLSVDGEALTVEEGHGNAVSLQLSRTFPHPTPHTDGSPTPHIVIEGWRNIPHSYAMVNQFQLLELCDRPNLEIFHRDVPYLRSHWQPVPDLFDPIAVKKLQQIPPPPPETADAILRMSIPYQLNPGNAKKTCVFCTTEAGIVTQSMLSGIGAASMPEALENSDVTIVTPSRWSRQGFLRSGVHPNRVVVVPHGVHINLYKPLPEYERNALRQQLGIADHFVFLNIGILSDNKGIRPLLKAFASIVDKYPQARLLLKGADSLFESTKFLTNSAKAVLTDAEAAKVESRLAYIGKSLSIPEMIRLYQAADIYLSPYLAEGFNLPVLEAAACGLPVICTQGGPTDDFTRPEFALQISSQIKPMNICGDTVFLLEPNLSHLIEQMAWAIAHPEFRLKTRKAAPKFIGEHFTWKKVVDQLLSVLIGNVLK
jgi:glycosyltransferase involved in cell wall biosynthesis